MNLIINDKKFPLEIKLTQRAKRQGMMNRTSLDGGMLFIFDHPKQQSFWMKDCLIPLDIVFLENGVITKICPDCQPCNENECERFEGYGDMVLEFMGGFCENNKLKEGDRVQFS